MRNTGFFITGLLAGAVIGSTLALLYAPQKGIDTRNQVRDKLREMETELDQVRDRIKEKGGEIKDEMKKKMVDLENRIESLLKEYKKNVTVEPAHGPN